MRLSHRSYNSLPIVYIRQDDAARGVDAFDTQQQSVQGGMQGTQKGDDGGGDGVSCCSDAAAQDMRLAPSVVYLRCDLANVHVTLDHMRLVACIAGGVQLSSQPLLPPRCPAPSCAVIVTPAHGQGGAEEGARAHGGRRGAHEAEGRDQAAGGSS